MRGNAARQATMLAAVTPDDLVPQGHPIRRSRRHSGTAWRKSARRFSSPADGSDAVKPMVDRALAQLSLTFPTIKHRIRIK